MTGYLDEVIAQARQWDHARPRSAQKALGWSGMAGCRAYMGYKVREDWESDETDTWRAIVGTALHEWITGVRYEACQATGLDASFEVPVKIGRASCRERV